jgi:pimeloyl-ACP methyl ester carboxylesterase
METFEYQDVLIRYLRAGAGDPLVLLHNGGTSHAIWRDVIPLLDGYEVFALDLLGFGESSKPERGYELERYVTILAAFIEAHGLAPAFLAGNCMGSAMSLAYAMQRPSAVRAMVLSNTLTTRTFAKGLYGPMLGLPRRAPALLAGMSKVRLGSWLGKYGVRSQLGRHGRERRVHERPELCAAYSGAAQSRALLGVLADIPSYAMLDSFAPPAGFPPICTIWGLENRVLRATEGRALVSTLRPARQEWLEGCGHLPMLEQPERVASILREFFASASASEVGEESEASEA